MKEDKDDRQNRQDSINRKNLDKRRRQDKASLRIPRNIPYKRPRGKIDPLDFYDEDY